MSGRAATKTIIPGRHALSVGNPGTVVPPGWAWLPLGQLADMGTGHTPSRNVPAYWDGDVPWIGIRDARTHHGSTIWNTSQTITQAGLDNSSARLLAAGTIALSRTASVGYVVQLGRDMATSQDFVTWTCSRALSPQYLMRAIEAEGDDIRAFGQGSTHTTIYFPELKALHIRVPPLPEQHRIVDKIKRSSLCSKNAHEKLTRAENLLARYKQSILANIISNKTDACDQTALDNIVGTVTSGSRDWAKYYDRGRGVFVLAGNVRLLRFDPEPKRFVDPPLDSADARRSRIRKDDLLITIVGAGTGDICHVDREVDQYFVCQSVALIRLKDARLAKFYAYWFASNEHGRSSIEKAMYGAARPHLSFEQIRSFSVPLIQADEAEKIVNLIENALNALQKISAQTKCAREQLKKLDQAILTKAFRGELIQQDPADEPARVLLDRVQAERAATCPAPKRGRRSLTSLGA